MYYPDFPFGAEHLPSFVGHADVLDYLKRYAEHFDLYQSISFHTLVEEVEPRARPPTGEGAAAVDSSTGVLDDVRWSVRSKDLETGRVSEDIFDIVLVCVG